MVDLSAIGRNLSADPLIAAQAAQAAGKTNKMQKKKTRSVSGGLGLADIPEESPYVNVESTDVVDQPEEVLAAAAAEGVEQTNAIEEIDYELVALQALIKKVISRKIALADKHDDRRHELLVSAFEDCKNAYLKIETIRQTLG